MMLTPLLSETRQALLRLFLMNPHQHYHLREVARQTGKPVTTVQSEVAKLADAGVVNKAASGNRTYYQANTDSPIYPELRALIVKTVGLVDVLRETLNPLGSSVEAAFVYGSMAAGEPSPNSDVDLLVVGEADDALLHAAVSRAEEELDRPVNYVLLSGAEFRQRRAEEGFLARVLRGPRLAVVGDVDELR
jgi:predicted nucleotidyltransferase